jgi:hypothetical protein
MVSLSAFILSFSAMRRPKKITLVKGRTRTPRRRGAVYIGLDFSFCLDESIAKYPPARGVYDVIKASLRLRNFLCLLCIHPMIGCVNSTLAGYIHEPS